MLPWAERNWPRPWTLSSHLASAPQVSGPPLYFFTHSLMGDLIRSLATRLVVLPIDHGIPSLKRNPTRTWAFIEASSDRNGWNLTEYMLHSKINITDKHNKESMNKCGMQLVRYKLLKTSLHTFLEDNIAWLFKSDGFTKLTYKKTTISSPQNILIFDYKKKSKQNLVGL